MNLCTYACIPCLCLVVLCSWYWLQASGQEHYQMTDATALADYVGYCAHKCQAYETAWLRIKTFHQRKFVVLHWDIQQDNDKCPFYSFCTGWGKLNGFLFSRGRIHALLLTCGKWSTAKCGFDLEVAGQSGHLLANLFPRISYCPLVGHT